MYIYTQKWNIQIFEQLEIYVTYIYDYCKSIYYNLNITMTKYSNFWTKILMFCYDNIHTE